ncbi:hypothetical protein PO909_025239, partial [Leuciscus waleckii]
VLIDHISSKYAIGRKLGEGGFGSVFEGTRCKDGLMVAVKFTAKRVALTVMANQGPSCGHIIKVLDWQDHLDQYIMVLEWPLPCMDMHSLWKRKRGRFSEGLAGVLHRDIKMQNLLVNTETLEVKLIDFGCGDLLKRSAYKTYSGTARYCPPEYLEKGKYFAKQATVWSLGVLLFAMITGHFPNSRDITSFCTECCHFIRGCLKSKPKRRLHLVKLLSHDWFKVLSLRQAKKIFKAIC